MAEDAGPAGPWLVVGLGNPGPQYAGNRHNVGAMVVAQLAGDLGARLSAHRSRAQVAEARLAPSGGRPGERVVLAVPTSYMNECGGQVTSAVRFFKVEPESLLVVHDDVDLETGRLQARRGGGLAGHNGLRSLAQQLGTQDFLRLRIGVGRPGRGDPRSVSDWVLSGFEPEDDVDALVSRAADAVEMIVAEGLDAAQARFN